MLNKMLNAKQIYIFNLVSNVFLVCNKHYNLFLRSCGC